MSPALTVGIGVLIAVAVYVAWTQPSAEWDEPDDGR